MRRRRRLAMRASLDMAVTNGRGSLGNTRNRLLQMLIEPGQGLALGSISGFVVNAVVFDVGNADELLDPFCPLVSQYGVLPVVEQFLVLGDEEQLGALLATANVFDWRVAGELLEDRRSVE